LLVTEDLPLYGLLLVLQVTLVQLAHSAQWELTQVISSIACVQTAQTCLRELRDITTQQAGMTLRVHMNVMMELHLSQVTKCV
jgi:uncharacterized protein YerC